MDDKTLQALTTLADKLGTTSEYLWGVLLKQAPITGVIDMVTVIVLVVLVVLWARFVQRKTSIPKQTENDRYPRAEWENEGAFFSWVSVFIMVLMVSLMVCRLSTTVAALVNPEYWAFKQIFK